MIVSLTTVLSAILSLVFCVTTFAAAALKFINEKVEKRPAVAVVYSHSHADHFGRVRGVVDEADVRSGKVNIPRG